VIEARRQSMAKDLKVPTESRVPRNLLAPGTPLINKHGQGIDRLATAGCLVQDGERYYVVTNRHVVGDPGTPICALQAHREPEIGVAASKGITREDFHAVYPNFRSTNQRLLMDVGLVEIDDVLAWKTDIENISPLGPVLDIYDNSLTVQLIGQKFIGRSAISGLIRGEIHGLFYRYKSMGGSEYISDFLLGPETRDAPDLKAKEALEKRRRDLNIELAVHHGDSGTVLHIEHTETVAKNGSKSKVRQTTYYPFALLWGKEEFMANGMAETQPYALATALSTALDRLNLDFVRGVNLDQRYIWGWVGHYIIGRSLTIAVDLLTSDLKRFVDKNIDLLALQPNDALDNNVKPLDGTDVDPAFVPLADVPDNVWKSNVNGVIEKGEDGKNHRTPGPGSRGQHDNKNHYCDLDLEYQQGKTFLELNFRDPDTYLNPSEWMKYYAAIAPLLAAWHKLLKKAHDKPTAANGSDHWGALPFRVHQLFDIMVAAAKDKDAALFLCAGGVLIHYIGDGCQPLHSSYMSNGDPSKVVPRPRSEGNKIEADGVHVGYEDDMIAYGHTDGGLDAKLRTKIKDLKSETIIDIKDGYDASKALIHLIYKTQQQIPPKAIVDRWVELRGHHKDDRNKAMWKTFGDDTIVCMARGTRYLTKIWQAAWDAGGGDTTIGEGTRLSERALMKLYNNPDKMPSVSLDQYPANPRSDWSGIKRPPFKPKLGSDANAGPRKLAAGRRAKPRRKAGQPIKKTPKKPAKKKTRRRA
jgi:hypothetical protein